MHREHQHITDVLKNDSAKTSVHGRKGVIILDVIFSSSRSSANSSQLSSWKKYRFMRKGAGIYLLLDLRWRFRLTLATSQYFVPYQMSYLIKSVLSKYILSSSRQGSFFFFLNINAN